MYTSSFWAVLPFSPYPLKLIKNNFATLYIPNIVKAFKLFDQKGFKDNEKHHFPHFC